MANEQHDIILRVKLLDEATERINQLKATLHNMSQTAGAVGGKIGAGLAVPVDFAAQMQALQTTQAINFDDKIKFSGDATKRIQSLRRQLEGTKSKSSLASLLDQAAASMERFGAAALRASGGIAGVAQVTGKLTAAPGRGKAKIGIADLPEPDRAAFERYYANASKIDRQAAESVFINNRKRLVTEEARGLLGRLNLSNEQPGGGFKGAAARVLLWGSSATLIYGGIAAIRKAIAASIDLENEIVQLQKVMSDTTPFEEMKQQMFSLSTTMGVAITDVTRIAKIWAQQGYEMAQTLSLTDITLRTMNSLSVSAAQATDYLTSVMRVWGVEVDQLKQNLAGIMKVQADYAIESEDLATIFTRIGAGVRAAGDDMAFLAGISTALRETTRKTSSQIFTSLKTIYAKSFKADALSALEAVGVRTKLNETTFRSFHEILTDLSKSWGTLTDVEKKNIAITLGQARYWSDFIALMDNFEKIAVPATNAFAQAWDEAAKASALQQNSLKNQLQGIASAALQAGDAFASKFFGPFVKTISGPLKGLFGLLKDLPQTSLATAGVVSAIALSFKSFLGFFPAYDKFLGRVAVSGVRLEKIFKNTATASAVAGKGVGFLGRTMAGLARTMNFVEVNNGDFVKNLAAVETKFVKLGRVISFTASVIGNVLKTVGKLALITAAFYVVEKVLDKLFSDKQDKKIDPFPEDVIQKLNNFRTGVSEINKETGKLQKGKLFGVEQSIRPLETLLDALSKFRQENGRSVTSFTELSEIIKKLDGTTMKFLVEKYGNIETSLVAQRKLWNDINTLAAIYNNVVLKDIQDKQRIVTEELVAQTKEIIPNAEIIAEKYNKLKGKIFNDDKLGITGKDRLLFQIEDKDIKEALSKINKTEFGKRLFGSLLNTGALSVGLSPGDKEKLTKKIEELILFLDASSDEQVQKILGPKKADLVGNLLGLTDETFGQVTSKTEVVNKIVSLTAAIVGEVTKATSDISGEFGKRIAEAVDFGNIVNKGMENVDTDAIARVADNIGAIVDKLNAQIRSGILTTGYGLQNESERIKEVANDYKTAISKIFEQQVELNGKQKDLQEQFNKILPEAVKDPTYRTLIQNRIREGKTIEDIIDTMTTDYSSVIEDAQSAAAQNDNALSENLKHLRQISQEMQVVKEQLKNANEAANPENIQKLLKLYYQFIDIGKKIDLSIHLNELRGKFEEDLAKLQNDIILKNREYINDIRNASLSATREVLTAQENQFGALLKLRDKELASYRQYSRDRLKIEVSGQKELAKVQTTNEVRSSTRKLGFDLAGAKYALQDLGDQLYYIDKITEVKKDQIDVDVENKKIIDDISTRTSIWNDQVANVHERTKFLRDTLKDSLIDFQEIQRTAGKSIIFDTLSKIGQKFQEQQAEILVNSLIKGNLGQKLLPNLDDIRFNEKLELLGESTYNVIFSAFVNGATAATQIFGEEAKQYDQKLTNYGYANKGFNRSAASLAAIGNVLSNIGLGQIIKATGRSQEEGLKGQAIGSQVGTVVASLLTKSNPYALAIGSILGSFGGGLGGIFGFGKKAENNQEQMVTQLNMIEQNTARTADLMEKFINIPGSVFIPPQGGFVMNITVNGQGSANEIAGQVMTKIRQEFNSASRNTGARGYFLS